MNLSFRQMRPTELSELLDLWVTSWSEVYAGISVAGRRDWFADHMVAWTQQGGLCLVAADTKNDTPAGFVLHNANDGHLDQFCVRSDLKGTGVAKTMMAEVRRLTPKGIHLDVNAMNERAIRFYEREGYVKTGEIIDPISGQRKYLFTWRP